MLKSVSFDVLIMFLSFAHVWKNCIFGRGNSDGNLLSRSCTPKKSCFQKCPQLYILLKLFLSIVMSRSRMTMFFQSYPLCSGDFKFFRAFLHHKVIILETEASKIENFWPWIWVQWKCYSVVWTDSDVIILPLACLTMSCFLCVKR